MPFRRKKLELEKKLSHWPDLTQIQSATTETLKVVPNKKRTVLRMVIVATDWSEFNQRHPASR